MSTPNPPAGKREPVLSNTMRMLESRWCDPDENLVVASKLAPVWVRITGASAPVKFGGGLTLELIERLRIEAWAPLAHTDDLSKREFEIFCDLARGLTCSEIAGTRYLSVKTVSTYRARIIEKTGLRNNAEIAVYASHTGIVKWGETRPATLPKVPSITAQQLQPAAS